METVSTFTSYELMDYTQFVKYAVYASMIALERRELHKKVIKGSEILEVLHQCPKVKQYLNSFYNYQYVELSYGLIVQPEDKDKQSEEAIGVYL